MLRLYRGGAGLGKGLSHMHVCSASCGRDPTPTLTDLLTTSHPISHFPCFPKQIMTVVFKSFEAIVCPVLPLPPSPSPWLDTGYIDYFISVFPNLKFICQNELSKGRTKDKAQREKQGNSFDGKLIFPHASDYGFASFFAKIALAKLSK